MRERLIGIGRALDKVFPWARLRELEDAVRAAEVRRRELGEVIDILKDRCAQWDAAYEACSRKLSAALEREGELHVLLERALREVPRTARGPIEADLAATQKRWAR